MFRFVIKEREIAVSRYIMCRGFYVVTRFLSPLCFLANDRERFRSGHSALTEIRPSTVKMVIVHHGPDMSCELKVTVDAAIIEGFEDELFMEGLGGFEDWDGV